jgi:hypothetical protein
MLGMSSVAVCLGGAQEAMALREFGVVGAVAGDDRDLPLPNYWITHL